MLPRSRMLHPIFVQSSPGSPPPKTSRDKTRCSLETLIPLHTFWLLPTRRPTLIVWRAFSRTNGGPGSRSSGTRSRVQHWFLDILKFLGFVYLFTFLIYVKYLKTWHINLHSETKFLIIRATGPGPGRVKFPMNDKCEIQSLKTKYSCMEHSVGKYFKLFCTREESNKCYMCVTPQV